MRLAQKDLQVSAYMLVFGFRICLIDYGCPHGHVMEKHLVKVNLVTTYMHEFLAPQVFPILLF